MVDLDCNELILLTAWEATGAVGVEEATENFPVDLDFYCWYFSSSFFLFFLVKFLMQSVVVKNKLFVFKTFYCPVKLFSQFFDQKM